MRALLRVALTFALVSGAPAGAVIIASGDGTGNTSAPPDDPGWGNVVNIVETGVYIGNGWVLTANHVHADNMIIDGDVYEPVPGSEVQLQTGGSNADLALFQIVRDPGLDDVPIRTSTPPEGSFVVMIGKGRNRGGAAPGPPEGCASPWDGWLWGAGTKMRWGTNVVEENDFSVSYNNTQTHAFRTDFSFPNDQEFYEAQAANGDSGGAVFVENESPPYEWELAGIMLTRDAWVCQPPQSALRGNSTYAADLSFYWDQIDAISSVPACDDGIDQDGDELIDYPDDPGCDDLLDPFETSDARPCDDGIDNDGDGGIDFDPLGEGDPGCKDPTWSTESPQCQDGVHNDADGRMDYDAGLFANGEADPAGPDSECVGKPWQNREAPQSSSNPCGLGAELSLLLPALMWVRRRRG